MKNIWKDELTKDIRAALVMVLSSVYVDSNPRTELIVPQMTRTLPAAGRSNTIDGSKSRSASIRKNPTGPPIIKEELEINMQTLAKENEMMMKLKTDLIVYLNEKVYTDHKKTGQVSTAGLRVVEFDSFLYNVISTAKKLAIFGLYSPESFTNLTQPQSKESSSFFGFSRKQGQQRSELAQLVNVLFPILITNLDDETNEIRIANGNHLDETIKGSVLGSRRSIFVQSYDQQKINNIMANVGQKSSVLMTKGSNEPPKSIRKSISSTIKNSISTNNINSLVYIVRNTPDEAIIKDKLRQMAETSKEDLNLIEVKEYLS